MQKSVDTLGPDISFYIGWKLAAGTLVFVWISISLQGFGYGGNNIYHVPLILSWANDPTFHDDAFIQSLSKFVSGFWVLVKPFADESNFSGIFYGLHLLVRWAAIISLVLATRTIYRTGPSTQVALAFWFAITPMLWRGSGVGGGDLFTTEFSHTEVALPLVLFSLAWAARGRLDVAFAINGIVFDINAFVAVWNGCAVALAAFSLVSQEKTARQILFRRCVLGLTVGTLLALPVAIWIVRVLHNQEPHVDFDYVGYLRLYFPNHFLIAAATPQALATLVAIGAGGFIGLRELGHAEFVWRGAFLGFCLIFAIGVILPELTHSATLLNLHLLRVDGEIQIVSLLGLTVVATQRLEGAGSDRLVGTGALMILSLPNPAGMLLAGAILRSASTTSRYERTAVIMVATVILAFTVDYTWRLSIAIAVCQIGVSVVCLIWQAWGRIQFVPNEKWLAATVGAMAGTVAIESHLEFKEHAGLRAEALSQIAQWARDATNPDSLFLIPPDDARIAAPFQIVSHRRIWVDQKRGAAVMWMPAYYFEWEQRIREVRALVSPIEKLRYACHNKINYVVQEKTPGQDVTGLPVAITNAYFLILNVPSQCK